MYAVSQEFRHALGDSHTSVAKLEVRSGDRVIDLEIIDGHVTSDLDAPIRRSLDCEVISEGRSFEEMDQLLDPYSSTLRAYRGVQFPDGSEEWVLLGTFFVEPDEIGESDGAATFRVQALDVASLMQVPLPAPYPISAGVPIHEATPPLLQTVYPSVSFRLTPTPFVTPTLLVREEANPWTEARALHAAAGQDLTVDRTGVVYSEARIAQVGEPSWNFIDDFWEPRRVRDKASYPNQVIVIGTNPLAPTVRGIASDVDPQSPTYIGRRVRAHIEKSEKVVTNEQAAAMADALLARLLGPQDEVTLSAVPNPVLDPGDTVTVTRPRIGLDGTRLIVSRIDMPLAATAPMQLTLRRGVSTIAPFDTLVFASALTLGGGGGGPLVGLPLLVSPGGEPLLVSPGGEPLLVEP